MSNSITNNPTAFAAYLDRVRKRFGIIPNKPKRVTVRDGKYYAVDKIYAGDPVYVVEPKE